VSAKYSTFKNIYVDNNGGILCTDTEKNSIYSFSHCSFTNITANGGAIVYDESDCG
jgi:hypothetical protein